MDATERSAGVRPALFRSLVESLCEALDGAGAHYWAIPRPTPGLLGIGVRDDQRDAVLTALRAMRGRDLTIARYRALPRRTPLRAMKTAAIIGTSRIARVMHEESLPRRASGIPETYIDLEFWTTDGGVLHAPRPSEFGATIPDRTSLPTATLKVLGHGFALPTYPELARHPLTAATFPIDVVYTWVDDQDPGWRGEMSRARRAAGGDPEDASPVRFRSRDELRYSLRSLDEFAPWARQVFIVTAGHVPPWLHTTDKVHLIRHDQIMEREHLPTFNSHAIEASLHRIDGLAEHFLYFNDDVVLLSHARPEHYFEGNGSPRFFMSQRYYSLPDEDVPGYKSAAYRGRAFMEATYGVTPSRFMRHTPHAHRVSTLKEFEREHPDIFRQTRQATFRGQGDFNVLASLAHFYAYVHGSASPADTDATLVDMSTPSAYERVLELYAEGVRSVCLNDAVGESPSDNDTAWNGVHHFLEKVLPAASHAERSA